MKRITGLAFVAFVFAIAGVIISALLIKEDVVSTAHTIFEFFPERYGVTPSSTWEGAIILGVFTSILQVVSASVAGSKSFSASSRGVAFLSFVSACVFDNWTDVVFRSGNLSGDVRIATITTLAFYTFGSEVTQGLSWLVITGFWRAAISDAMRLSANFSVGMSTISSEWKSVKRATWKGSFRDNEPEDRPYKPDFSTNTKSFHPNQPNQTPAQRAQDRFQKKNAQSHVITPVFMNKPGEKRDN